MIDLATLIHECAPNVGANTVMAIMHVESSFRPNAIGYKVVTSDRQVLQLERQPKDVQEAIGWAEWFIQNGYKFDAGLLQINSTNFKAFGLTAKNAFDPCTNIRAGAAILSEAYQRAVVKHGQGRQALYAALSAYNSGNFKTGFETGYVAKVAAKAGAPAPTALLPPLTASRPAGMRAVAAMTDPAKPKNTLYAVPSRVTSFTKGWDAPTAWIPNQARALSGESAPVPAHPE